MALNAELPNRFLKNSCDSLVNFPLPECPGGWGRNKDELWNGCVWERGRRRKGEEEKGGQRGPEEEGREGTKEMDGGGREEQRI